MKHQVRLKMHYSLLNRKSVRRVNICWANKISTSHTHALSSTILCDHVYMYFRGKSPVSLSRNAPNRRIFSPRPYDENQAARRWLGTKTLLHLISKVMLKNCPEQTIHTHATPRGSFSAAKIQTARNLSSNHMLILPAMPYRAFGGNLSLRRWFELVARDEATS
jgi:hypothetical protein